MNPFSISLPPALSIQIVNKKMNYGTIDGTIEIEKIAPNDHNRHFT